MKTEEICDRIVRTLAICPFIKGIVLGGSRATNTDEADSDIDIGIYYEKEKLDYGMLNRLARNWMTDTGRIWSVRKGDGAPGSTAAAG